MVNSPIPRAIRRRFNREDASAPPVVPLMRPFVSLPYSLRARPNLLREAKGRPGVSPGGLALNRSVRRVLLGSRPAENDVRAVERRVVELQVEALAVAVSPCGSADTVMPLDNWMNRSFLLPSVSPIALCVSDRFFPGFVMSPLHILAPSSAHHVTPPCPGRQPQGAAGAPFRPNKRGHPEIAEALARGGRKGLGSTRQGEASRR
jgi:hypothetical protein